MECQVLRFVIYLSAVIGSMGAIWIGILYYKLQEVSQALGETRVKLEKTKEELIEVKAICTAKDMTDSELVENVRNIFNR